MTRRYGYSLVEMLIVMTLLGLLAALAVIKLGVSKREALQQTVHSWICGLEMHRQSLAQLTVYTQLGSIPYTAVASGPYEGRVLSTATPIQFKELTVVGATSSTPACTPVNIERWFMRYDANIVDAQGHLLAEFFSAARRLLLSSNPPLSSTPLKVTASCSLPMILEYNPTEGWVLKN